MMIRSNRYSLFWGVLLFMTILYMSPFFLFTYPPFVDVPQHLATLSVLKGMGDPSTGYAEKFIVEWFPNTNVGFFGVAHFLGRFMTLVWAVKICILLYISGLVVALIWLHRLVHNRNESPPWAFLLIFPFLYNSSLLLGLINYCMSLSLFFFWLCVTIHGLDHFSWKHCLCHALLLLALFVFHSQTYLFAGLCSSILLFFFYGWRNKLNFIVGWLPSLAFFGLWYVEKFASTAGKISFAGLDKGFGAEFAPLFASFRYIVANTFGFSRHVWWDKALLGLIVVILCAWRPYANFQRSKPVKAVFVACFMAVVCYLFLPLNIKLQFFVSARMLIIAWFAGLVLFAGTVERLPRKALILASLLLPIVFWIKWLPSYQDVNQSWRQAAQLLRQVPPNAKLLGLPFLQFEYDDEEENFPRHLHTAALYLLEKPGEVASNFMILPSSPIRYRYPEKANIILPDGKANVKPWCALLSGGWGNDADYVLARGIGGGLMPWWEKMGRLKFVANSGRWFLYRRVGELSMTEDELQAWWIPLTCNKRIQPMTSFLDIFQLDTSRNLLYNISIQWWRNQYGVWKSLETR